MVRVERVICMNNSNQLLVVINASYGGFGLSDLAWQWLLERGFCPQGGNFEYNCLSDEDRCHPLLVECVLTLGEQANGSYSCLKVVAISNDYFYRIEEYDGYESLKLVPRASIISQFVENGDTEGLLNYLSRTGGVSFK